MLPKKTLIFPLKRWNKQLPGNTCGITMFISSSKMVVIMITKDSLFLDTMIFGLQCSQMYSVPIILVHDLESCQFPNPAVLPKTWQVRSFYCQLLTCRTRNYSMTKHSHF